jgi:hypothetical protein
LYCIAGGVALGYEVVWSQSIVQFMSTRAHAFALVLATYLCGLAAGSALYARRADRLRDPWGLFAVLIASAGLLALLQLAGLGRWLVLAQTQAELLVLQATGNELAGMCARFAVAAMSMVLLPTVLLGAAFPLAVRLAVDGRRVGRDVGTVVALNTLGGILGVGLTGFVLIPAVGLVRTLALLAGLAALVGVDCGMAWQRRGAAGQGHGADGGHCLRGGGRADGATPGRAAAWCTQRPADFYREGKGGTVAVVKQTRQGRASAACTSGRVQYRRCHAIAALHAPAGAVAVADSRWRAAFSAGDRLWHRHHRRRDAALPGPGTPGGGRTVARGTTPRRCSRATTMPCRTHAWTSACAMAAASCCAAMNATTWSPWSRHRLRRPVWSTFIRAISTSWPPTACNRGLLAQWLPLPTQNDEDTRALVRSFIDVFPHASLWTTEFHEMLLIGSLQPLHLDVPRIQRFSQLSVASTLAEVGIDSPQALLATWITDRAGLARYAGNAAAVTDDQPRIEYAPWVRPREITGAAGCWRCARHRRCRCAAPGFAGAVNDQWLTLQRFYSLSLHAYNGNCQAWAREAGRWCAGWCQPLFSLVPRQPSP